MFKTNSKCINASYVQQQPARQKKNPNSHQNQDLEVEPLRAEAMRGMRAPLRHTVGYLVCTPCAHQFGRTQSASHVQHWYRRQPHRLGVTNPKTPDRDHRFILHITARGRGFLRSYQRNRGPSLRVLAPSGVLREVSEAGRSAAQRTRPPVRPPFAQSRAAAIDLATKDAIGERCGKRGGGRLPTRRAGQRPTPKLMNGDSGSASRAHVRGGFGTR